MNTDFQHTPITATAARKWHGQHMGGKFPAWQRWVFVSGLQFYPQRPCYLEAGENGLTGIVSIKVRAAKREAA